VDRRRLTVLSAAGLIDSAGLALGWTVFVLYAADHQGLIAVGVYHGAMYAGIALSYWFTAWLSRRLTGRQALRGLAATEALLRVGGFVLLLLGCPVLVVAGVVLVQNVIAWTGYALMRAEIAAVDPRSASLTRYGVCIGAAETAAAALATFLPTEAARMPVTAVVGVSLAYAGCLLPTWHIAGAARTARVAARKRAPQRTRTTRTRLSRGAVIMLVAAGPTLLAVPLANQLAGRAGVMVALLAFTVGTLGAPRAAHLLDRLPSRLAWPLLGLGMVAGWTLAPVHLLGLAVAQALAGTALTAIEGMMDARLYSGANAGPSALAAGASARALGGAGAVLALPLVLGHVGIGALSAVLSVVLVVAALSSRPRLAHA
jgi:hypothetical protein